MSHTKNSTPFIQILSTNQPSLLIQSTHCTVLINTPPNITRILNSNASLPSLKHLKHVYFDSLYADRQDGLSGVVFSSYQSGVRELRVTGTRNLYHYLQYMRFFIRRRDLTVYANEIDPLQEALSKGVAQMSDSLHKAVTHDYDDFSMTVMGFSEEGFKVGGAESEEDTSTLQELVLTEKHYEKSVKPSYIYTGTTRRIYFGGFDESVTESDLESWFQKYGTIENIELPRRPSNANKCRQFAYITFSSLESVEALLQDWTYWKSQEGIHIDEDTNLKFKVYYGDNWRVCQLVNDASQEDVQPLTNMRFSNSFAIKVKDQRGKFNAELAKQLGVKGRDCNRLIKGESVTLDNGDVVHPHQVIAESKRGKTVLVVCVPSQTMLLPVTKSPLWKPYIEDESIAVIYHMIAPRLLNTDVYMAFMSQFKQDSLQHIIVNEECTQASPLPDSLQFQAKLNVLNPDLYPLPEHTYTPQRTSNISAHHYGELFSKVIIHPANFHSEPSPMPLLNIPQLQKDLAEKLAPIVEEYREEQKNSSPSSMENDPRMDIIKMLPEDDAELSVLGTAAANSSKFRNVTGMYLKFAEGGLFMDCGEGTLDQLYRVYGKEDTPQLLFKTWAIFISHMHADHHCGTLTVILHREILAKMHNVQLEPIIIIGHHKLNAYLRDVKRSMYNTDFEYIFVDSTEFRHEKNAHVLDALRDKLHCSTMKLVDVTHCDSAQGLVLERNKNGTKYKIVYSGDCRPSEQLIAEGKDALLLIHEASFEGTMKAIAVEKKHSTTEEAITVGESMNAFLTLLIHFSQRYPQAPPQDSTQNNCAAPAFDLLRLNMKNLWKLPRLNKLYDLVFEEEMDEDEERTLDFLDNHEEEVEEIDHIPCRFYTMGRCFSSKCPFFHDPELPYIECIWKADCPYGTGCWFRHPKVEQSQ